MHELEELLKQLRSNPENKELKKKVRQWLYHNREDSKTTSLLRSHWDLLEKKMSERELKRLNTTLKVIHHKSGMTTTCFRNNKTRRISRSTIFKIAATLFIPIMIYTVVEYGSPWGTRAEVAELIAEQTTTGNKHFFLPDSTEVWLNSESRLDYPSDFEQNKQRIVNLSGQAFFKVTHDADHPFIVQTSDMDIRVVGTSFDVAAYADEKHISSVLEEGAIVVLDKYGKALDRLFPGEKVLFNKQHKTLEKTKVKTENFTSWTSGKLVFHNAGIAEVVRKLERRFGYTISVSEEIMKKKPTYTFSVKDEKIEEICQLICLSTDAEAFVEGKHIRLEKN